MNNILTPKQVALKLQVNVETIYRWLHSKRLKGYKLGWLWRIREQDLERLITGTGEAHAEVSNANVRFRSPSPVSRQ